MNILVATYHLEKTGGTENYTYAIVRELLRLGHHVEYFTYIGGEIANKIEDLVVRFKSKKSYDLILANHSNVVDYLHPYGCIIQTCHGIYPWIEQPSKHADYYVGISYEVQEHLKQLNISSTLINNGIDCERFRPKKEIRNSLTSVLSLCQSEEANSFIQECCDAIGVTFQKVNKHTDNLWEIENIINENDLVVGIGRSIYDAMACGRAIISYDNRSYSKDFGDGYLNSENIDQSIKYNCSGRGLKKTFSKEMFIEELKKYDSNDGRFFRAFALNNLNVTLSVSQYLQIVSAVQLKIIRIKKFLILGANFIKRKILFK